MHLGVSLSPRCALEPIPFSFPPTSLVLPDFGLSSAALRSELSVWVSHIRCKTGRARPVFLCPILCLIRVVCGHPNAIGIFCVVLWAWALDMSTIELCQSALIIKPVLVFSTVLE